MAARLEALGQAARLAIFRRLVRAGEAGLSVGALQEAVGLPASTLSHHLRRLIAAGLVTQERRGATLICRAGFGAMRALIGYLADECCADERRS
jgi:DNA-binding transcriptional ArsR family regulator